MSRKTKEKKRKQFKKNQVKTTKQVPNWVGPLVLGFLVVGTFLLRVLPGWDTVFVNGGVWYREVDAWYHMRLVENMIVNFPQPLQWDMLILYPDGMGVGYFPLLSWIITILGKIFNYELVGAFLPPIIGALSLIPVYLICKTLWKDWIGLIACMLMMLLPTEFFHRTLLGFTDHHMLEIAFIIPTILFLILMTKERRLRWVILSGVFLGLYTASWGGGLILVSLIWIWFFVALIMKLRKQESIEVFCKDMSSIFALGLILFIPNVLLVQGLVPHFILIAIITCTPIILYLASKKLKWLTLTIGTVACIGLTVLVMQLAVPSMIQTAKAIFISTTTSIQEAQMPDPQTLMSHYGVGLLLAFLGLGLLVRRKENLLMIIWCAFMLILGLSQKRWSYYFTINISILIGYATYAISGWVHKSTRVAVISIICIIIVATTVNATIKISQLPGILTPGWYQTCLWLRSNTPDLPGYYELEAPKADYGILSWWDFGSWITTVGHRAPCSNPMAQGPEIQWQVLLALSEEEANNFTDSMNIDYIVVDEPMVTGKLYAIVRLSQKSFVDSDYDKLFVVRLWKETATTWRKIYQAGEVKVFGRT